MFDIIYENIANLIEFGFNPRRKLIATIKGGEIE